MLKKDKIKSSVRSLISSPPVRLYSSIFIGLVVNVTYISANLHAALISENPWPSAVIVYYLLFIILRLYLLWSRNKNEYAVARRCLTVGIFLLLLTVIAGVIIAYNVASESCVKYSGYVLVGFFVFTVYSITTSLLGMKKWLNDNQPLHFAARTVTLAAALMSVFNLQFSLLSSLGLSDFAVKRANAIGGFAVFFIIAALSVNLVLKSIRS